MILNKNVGVNWIWTRMYKKNEFQQESRSKMNVNKNVEVKWMLSIM